MNFEKDAHESKNRFAQNAVSHMGAIQKLVTKNYRQFQIESAFHFDSWFQMYLSHNNFFSVLSQVKKLYKEDGIFQKYVTLDARNQEKELTPKQIDFYLEEHAFAYLLLNQRLHLQNDFVNNRESWILLTYPGDPPLGQIYLHQKDPLTIKEFSTNPYKGQYNLITRKFIDYEKFDLNLVQLH